MKISDTDVARVQQVLIDAHETVLKETITLDGNKLTFRVQGTDRSAQDAINALIAAGLNWISDGDENTLDNGSVPAGIGYQDVVMTIAEGGLWK